MATQTYLTTASNQPWSYSVSGDGTLKLNTAGTYLDRNIEIVVPPGAYSASITSNANATKNKTNPVVTPSIGGNITSAATITTTKPSGTNGTDYFTIDPGASLKTSGSATVSNVKGTAKIDTAGYIPQDTTGKSTSATTYTVADIGATIESGTNYYLPIKKLTTGMVSKVNYIEAADPTEVSSGFTDKLVVTIKPDAGYYDGSQLQVEFTNILPNVDADLAASYILTGRTAYSDSGLKIVGSMPNNGTLASASVTGTKGSGSVTGSSVTLDSSNTASGISVSGKGTVTPKATLALGYYQSGTTSGSAVTSNTQTKYITDLTLASGKTLNSIANNGTITTLSGTGTIGTVSGTQTINSLTGAITIAAASDANTATANSNAKLTFHDAALNKDVLLVKDGALIQGSAEEGSETNAGKIVINPGWIDSAATVNIGTGTYSATLSTATNPAVSYSKSTNMTTSTTQTDYYFSYGGTVTAGTYVAKAEITKAGYIAKGNKTAGSTGNVGVSESNAGTVYIQAATFGKGLVANNNYAASDGRPAGVVPRTFDFSVTQAGYTVTGVKDQVAVFDGSYDWIHVPA